jgi:hypothetical protein
MTHRIISQTDKTFKISLPKPEGGYWYRSVGYVCIGETHGLELALSGRNSMGKKLWRKFWLKVLNDLNTLKYLPRSLEPVYR